MLRLNKTQKEIEGLVPKLPKITDAQLNWAQKNFSYFVVAGTIADTIRCPECGCKFAPIDCKRDTARWNHSDNEVRCPHCGSLIQVRSAYDGYSGKARNKHEDFFEVMNVVGEWQVTRLIYMRRYCYTRKENTPWEFYECCQAWNNPKYKTTYFRALDKACCMSRPFCPYSLWAHSDYELVDGVWISHKTTQRELLPRIPGGMNYFETNNIAPNAKILPFYQQRGLTINALRRLDRNAMWLFEMLVSDKKECAMYETLIKAKDYAMFNRLNDGWRANTNALYTAWKICQRNGYKRKNDTEWFDLVTMLADMNMDYHNPHYVCPANLHEAHQELVRRKEREELRQREQEELARLERDKKAGQSLEKRVARYLNMSIHGFGLHLVVLATIKDFRDEGKSMCHCVYSGRYYARENSLLLSARDSKGKRWETIEVSLKDLKVLQCYGYGDKFTEKHNDILALVNQNMWQIKERRNGKKLAKAS